MSVILDSRRVLVNLYDTLTENEKATSPTVTINMKNYATQINMSKEQLNLCINVLNNAGYIICDHLEYDDDDNATKNIVLTLAAFKVIEENRGL